MLQKIRTTLVASGACGLLSLAACTSVPPFELADHLTPGKEGPKFADVVSHIQCTVWRIIKDDTTPAESQMIVNADYIAAATITADVVETNGLNPSLSFMRPLAEKNSSLTLAVGGSLTGTNHRNFTYAFPIELTSKDGRSIHNKGGASCPPAGIGIGGDLGLYAIIIGGLASVSATDEKLSEQTISPTSNKNWIFGSTIEFTVAEGVNGGPNWSLTHFKGPTSSQGLLSAMRTAKDTLLISFAPTKGKATAVQALARRQSHEAAYGAGQDFNTRMILQNLLSTLQQ